MNQLSSFNNPTLSATQDSKKLALNNNFMNEKPPSHEMQVIMELQRQQNL